MTKVTNKHKGMLNIAGVDVRPGATVQVDDKAFKTWTNGNAAKIWLKMGIVEADTKVDVKSAKEPVDDLEALRSKASGLGIDFTDETTEDELKEAIAEVEASNKDNEPNERETLLAEARALGLNPNANTGVVKLQKMIADKKAE